MFQIAENDFEFALLPHAEATPESIDAELLRLEKVSVSTMSGILSFYPIDKDKIFIVPWKDPILQYYQSTYWIRQAGESEAEYADRQAAYREEIHYRLLDFSAEFPGCRYCDCITVDIDGDDKQEMCLVIEEGVTGNFPFYRFLAKERGEEAWEYDIGVVNSNRKSNGYIDYRDIVFVQDALGRVYMEAQCHDGDLVETRRIDMEFTGESVQFLYKGKILLGGQPETTLMFAEPSLSWVTSDVPVVMIRDRNLYDYRKGLQPLGGVTEITLVKEMLEQLINGYGGQYRTLAEEILQNNFRAFEIYPTSPEGVDLYYFLVQKDGTRLLVYGHYENGEKNGFLRWIFERA